MLISILKLINGVCLLIFGITLTAAFAGLRFSRKNVLIFLGLFLFSGILQAIGVLTVSESFVWKVYPLITHLPLILLLRLVYHKPTATAISASFTAYMCCQPSKWFGVLAYYLAKTPAAEYIVRILFLLPVGYIAISRLSPYLSKIFSKDRRSVYIFGLVPTVYYVYDYITSVYTELWLSHFQVVIEFLPFFLAVMYMAFCFLYYKEYEQKADAMRKEQIIRIAIEQQTKEISAVRQTEQDIRLLRHDMRMILSSLAVSIDNNEIDAAKEMINSHIARIDGTRLERFCSNDIINCVISDYATRCKAQAVPFSCSVTLDDIHVDETMFASILSNALDNALNAQRALPLEKRSIKLMIKNSGIKLLMSVKNPIGQPVIFSDGLPVSGKDGHGYGTQSIRFLTDQMGGNCQFSVQEDTFILRVVL